MRTGVAAALAVLALAATAAPARAVPRPPGCRGSIAGAVSGRFDCDATITRDGEGRIFLVISPRGPIEGIPAYAPGAFELTEPPRPGTYTLDTLGPGRASVAAEGGALYSATKTSSQRGEVTLVLRSVRAAGKDAWRAAGIYRAKLLPVGAGKDGTVTIEVELE